MEKQTDKRTAVESEDGTVFRHTDVRGTRRFKVEGAQLLRNCLESVLGVKWQLGVKWHLRRSKAPLIRGT